LYLVKARSVVLAVHCSEPFEIQPTPTFDPDAYAEAVERPILEKGACTEYDDGRIKLYILKSGYGGVSFLVQNCVSDTEPWKSMGSRRVMLHFHLDCSESVNTMSHRGSLCCTLCIPPGEVRVGHHLMPIDASREWDWTYEAAMKWEENERTNEWRREKWKEAACWK